MIVRERRRVAALARTASSLDERVQAAEQAAESSEAALRSYMTEQRHELAALNQNQQEQILSLMDMVKDSNTSTAAGIATSEGQESTTKGSTDPRLLVLANERIHVLEWQIQGLQSEASATESYRERTEELSSSLATASQENDDLQADLSHLRAALRQIREVASRKSPASGGEDYDSPMTEIFDIVKQTLHPSHVPAGKGKKRSSKVAVSRSSGRQFLSPRLKKHIELMHTSDSSDDVDDPDWADEIMTDLALIAEGKVPPSMEKSPAVMGAKFRKEEETIFDRLNNPETFTGTQKQTRVWKTKRDKGRIGKAPLSSGQEERRAMSKEIANRLEQIELQNAEVQHPTNTETPKESGGVVGAAGEGGDATTSSDQHEYKSVFERLVSPSQYTGTQKEKFHHNQHKIIRSTEDGDDRLLDDLLKSDDSNHEHSESTGVARSVSTHYTEQDVFERLQKTTTQSYAVKHNGTLLPEHSGFYGRSTSLPVVASTNTHEQIHGKSPPSSTEVHSQDSSSHSDYTNQNVFERLQKTTTEAYAKKTNKGKRGGKGGETQM